MGIQKILFLSWAVLLAAGFLGCRPFHYGQPPVLRLEKVHDSGTTALAFDPTGTRIASGGYRGEIIIWFVPSGRRLATLKAHRRPVRGLVWLGSANLLSGAEDGQVILWDTVGGRVTGSAETGSPVTSIALLQGRRAVFTGHTDGWVRSFSLPDLRRASAYHAGAPVLSLAADERQEKVACSVEDGRILFLSQALQLTRELERSSRDAFEIRFSPDGKHLAGGAWYQLLFWDVETGRLAVKETGHWGKVASVDYSPDGRRFASIGRVTDNTIRIRDVKSGSTVLRLERHALCGSVVRFSPQGRYLASGSDDESVRLYDLSKADR